jgi:hypothetical protein
MADVVHARIRKWQEHMLDDMKDNHSQATFRWIKNEPMVYSNTLEIITKVTHRMRTKQAAAEPAVKTVFDPMAICEHIKNAWIPILRATDNTDVPTFLREMGPYISTVQQARKPPSGEELQNSIWQMKDGAVGFDRWSKKELASLPLRLWNLRAQIDTMAETNKSFFKDQTWLNSQCLPRPGPPTPTNKRFLSIFSLLHRAKMRTEFHQYFKPWQEKWAHGGLLGARAHKEALQGVLELSLDIDIAKRYGEVLDILMIDKRKFFDLLKHPITFALLKQMGMDVPLLEYIQAVYSNITRVFKVGPCYADEFEQTVGFGQGDIVAIIAANAHMNLWITVIQNKAIAKSGRWHTLMMPRYGLRTPMP